MSSSKSRPLEHHEGPKGEIMRMGYLKKLKTMKKKFFILRGESSEASARLEYYDSEKKWRNSQPPKRTISLKTCFNINRRRDTKQKYVIALYTKDDCFCIVLESEEELQEWLKVLLKLQTGEDCVDGEPPKPTFKHVWKVNLQEKGLGDSKNLFGPYHVCLTDQTLSLVKITDDDTKPETLEFPLNHIRSCGVTGSYFYIEVGRHTVTGAGALWMLTEDANIAKNMNTVIFSAFRQCEQDQRDSNPHRKRSSSATESSKPATNLQRRQTHGGVKPFVIPGYSAVPAVSSLALPAHPAAHCVPRPPSQRRHSVSAMSSGSVLGTGSVMQHQHVNAPSSTSEPSDTCNGPFKTLTIVHQRTKSCPISESSLPAPLPDASPLEPRRNSNPLCPIHRDGSQNSTEFAHAPGGDGSGDYKRSARRVSSSFKSMTGTRERSDSMPSRNRTSSECGHHVGVMPHPTRISHYGSRPLSMHSRGLSYSPPIASGPCSTDSAGSSVSIDDGEMDMALSATSPRYGHSSTPDEPAILEENCDDYSHWTHEEEIEKTNAYVPMDRPAPSLSLPIHSSGVQRKVSAPASLKSGMSHQPYMEMCSPYGSSPLETGNYLPMSPGEVVRRAPGSGSFHSRGSSFAEETVDGYVPMAPNPTDDGYVDMEPLPGHRLHGDDHHSDMSPGSSCSFTSGTPSADMRFPDYHLEKVSSYFTPSEEDEISSNDRPCRTYSFGSQSETKKAKGKMEVLNNSEDFRVRAFSVGSKWSTPRTLTKEAHRLPSRTHVLPHSTKSSSAPLLSSSWSGTTRQQQAVNDPMADLMEMDFRENKKKKWNNSRFRVTPMKETSSQLNLDLKNTLHTVGTSSSDSGYVDMSSKSPSGGSYPSKSQNYDNFSVSPPTAVSSSPRTQALNAAFGKSPPKAFAFGRSPPKSPLTGPDGVTNKPLNVLSPPEMSSRLEPKNTRLIKSAIIPTTTLKTIGEGADVKPQTFPTMSSANLNMFALPNKMPAPKHADDAYVDMRLGSIESKDESYVEMSGRNNRKFTRANSDKDFSSRDSEASKPITRKTSVDNSSLRCGNDDYLLMTGGSQPIAIRNSPSGGQPSTSPNFLQLGGSSPLNSIRRNSRRKNRRKSERRGSKDGTSPLSPAQNFVDGSEGATPTNSPRESTEASPMDESAYIEMNFNEEESPYAEMTPGVEIEDQRYSVILAGSSLKVVENSVRDRTDPREHANLATKSAADADYTFMSPIRSLKTVSDKDSVGERVKLSHIPSSNTSTSVPYSATANETEPKSDNAQKCESMDSQSSSQASSPYPEKTNCNTPKDNDGPLADEKTAESLSRLSLDNSKAGLKAGQRSPISRQVSSSSTSSTEFGERRTATAVGPDHMSVSRQVSTSSSSSTEVMSVKEGSSPMPANAPRSPSRPSSVNSERDITYASLDLAPAPDAGDECLRSPLNTRPESSGSSPSPNPTVPSDSFTYVEIDFEKSSSLRNPQTFGQKIQDCPQN
ncbi:UNVERIFIED_CONTAM: hypothetical protein PYX00_002767 [Menopon gallinae]|uniref:Insulin receptor substrate 1 n=1 Tax=Menopon gallinae TaxID=328185 RepID=A0AAW2HYR6_9NEOP